MIANELSVVVIDATRTVTSPPDTPPLYVLTDELGQGGPTALRQIAAEELDLDGAERVRLKADTTTALSHLERKWGRILVYYQRDFPMRYALAFLLALLVPASAVLAQVIPTDEQRQAVGPLVKAFAGVEIMKAEIANLRGQLARCDGPANQQRAPDNCAARTLIQAKLNYLLKVSSEFGDPDNAGAPPVPLTKPPQSSSNYTDIENFLEQEIRKEAPSVYVISENRAKWWVIKHCKAMKDLYYLSSLMTAEELKAGLGAAAAAKTKADVNACVNEYDAQAIVTNRKGAAEYCFQASNYTVDSFAASRFDVCMNKHDMLQAMCKRQLELQEAYARRKRPEQQHAPQTCMGLRLSPGEIQAIQAAPTARTMAELPPRFFAPPDVVIAPRPPLPIPAGTVLEARLQGGLDGIKVEIGVPINAIIDQPLVAQGQTVIPAHAGVFIRGRIIGLGTGPDTVQIGLTTDEVNIDSPDCKVCGKYADLKSNELVFTVPNRSNALNPGIQFDTKFRFTIGGSGSVVQPLEPGPAQPVPTPPRPAPSPTTSAAAPAGGPLSPQSQAEDARKRGERIQTCLLQVMRDHPSGGIEQAQAMSACVQTK